MRICCMHSRSLLSILAAAAMVVLVAVPNVDAGMSDGPSANAPKIEVSKEKQTTLGLYVTAKEAFEMWRRAPDKLKILDVRTSEEFIFVGHAESAWNIPFTIQTYQWDDVKKSFPMKPNAEFVSVVESHFAHDDTLLVMCRSGGRSAMAVNALAKAGFRSVYNIIDGMEGDMVEDPESVHHGTRTKNGWKNSGIPWTYKVDPKRMEIPAQR